MAGVWNDRLRMPPDQAVGVVFLSVCSVGMLVANKMAVIVFPLDCLLVATQMIFACVALIVCCWRHIYIGSLRDVLRWSLVAPFFTGRLLTAILAVKDAPMTLYIVSRAFGPVLSMAVERFYPNPLPITMKTFASLLVMCLGAFVYVMSLPTSGMRGIGWVTLNAVLDLGDRLLERLMLSKDQNPVNISKVGCALLNNCTGLLPVLLIAALRGECQSLPAVVAKLDPVGATWVFLSCAFGLGMGYLSIWVMSLISTTSYLVLTNANRFGIIFLEAYVMRSKELGPYQVIGGCIATMGAVLYGVARVESESAGRAAKADLEEADETRPLLGKDVLKRTS
mmetsp:Transcript_59156/g.152138  ORF Transcript_59156/g.152138 Transcript_59156/m.152138 type:complete len:338 (+) Transcript_59156:59-1072(+)